MGWCSEVITLSLAPPPVGLFSNNNKSAVFQFQKPLLKFKFNNSTLVIHRNPPLAAQLQQPSSSSSSRDFVVVNFYHFVFIKNPQQQVAKHLSFLELEGLDINGRVYLNEQGINAQYSGPSKDAMAYVNWIKEDSRFSDILVQISPSQTGHTFPSLKLRYKPSLVQFKGGISDLSLLDPSMRALPLSPSEWRKRLEVINKNDPHSKDYTNRNNIILDVRNGYEWDIGHFRGAQRPNVDCFRSTSFGLSQEITASDPLSNVDKENANILMYCTGGIRCDVYSTILRQHGFQNLYTLKGGVSHYIKNEGAAEWIGNLFVFDSRLSLPPPVYYPQAIPEGRMTPVSRDDKFAKCYICNVEVSELRHRNCANLDCNLLFLCCRKCVKDLRGCCCLTCTTAPRLRPALIGEQRYRKWHIYRDMDLQGKGN
ncbi:rhodanese-like domain-containing protein 8, chloroplastic isoform X2 [Vicia villosa]|uniref:rhodanese-like domain-containing protein 8, chloroplastic isoform X2 n=1 Tax=Vicia villosa TaxID=3911 RepID=UPI00273B1AF7|nr:rhodanese-like domain-containing protein 8, chloroplastic isoform X2 [Vicia villosa]